MLASSQSATGLVGWVGLNGHSLPAAPDVV